MQKRLFKRALQDHFQGKAENPRSKLMDLDLYYRNLAERIFVYHM